MPSAKKAEKRSGAAAQKRPRRPRVAVQVEELL